MSHRLFVAIQPPSAIREALLAEMHGVAQARWQDDGQLHLTLRYIGEVDANTADDLADALSTIHPPALSLTVEGTGYFEKKDVPHTLWAAIAANEQLLALQRKVERVCIACGQAPETRKYAPHITLARLNSASGPIDGFLARTADLRLGPWRSESFVLYESHLGHGGARYEPVIEYKVSALT